MTAVLPRPDIDPRQVEHAVSLNGHPTRPLTNTELTQAIARLRAEGCVWAEIQMRLGENP